MGSKKVLPQLVKVDLEELALKKHATISKALQEM